MQSSINKAVSHCFPPMAQRLALPPASPGGVLEVSKACKQELLHTKCICSICLKIVIPQGRRLTYNHQIRITYTHRITYNQQIRITYTTSPVLGFASHRKYTGTTPWGFFASHRKYTGTTPSGFFSAARGGRQRSGGPNEVTEGQQSKTEKEEQDTA